MGRDDGPECVSGEARSEVNARKTSAKERRNGHPDSAYFSRGTCSGRVQSTQMGGGAASK
jgi:hypothetical protein